MVSESSPMSDETDGTKRIPVKSGSKRIKTPFGKGCLMEQTQARQIAKAGLIASMGILAVSGFIRSKTARRVHVAAGIAALGLSVWHYTLYPASSLKKTSKKGDPGIKT